MYYLICHVWISISWQNIKTRNFSLFFWMRERKKLIEKLDVWLPPCFFLVSLSWNIVWETIKFKKNALSFSVHFFFVHEFFVPFSYFFVDIVAVLFFIFLYCCHKVYNTIYCHSTVWSFCAASQQRRWIAFGDLLTTRTGILLTAIYF